MIRGHRRKGFKDPPKPVVAPVEIPRPSAHEKLIKMPSPIKKTCDKRIVPSTVPEVRNKRLFDSTGFHDPKNALLPAKLRLKPTKESSQTASSNELKSSSICSPSPILIEPLSSTKHSNSLAVPIQCQQKQPIAPPPPTILHNKPISNKQNKRPPNPSETNKSAATKRGRRIKITPRRETNTKSPEKAIERPKISQCVPSVIRPNFPYAPNQRVAVLSDHQSNLSMLINCLKLN